MLIFYNYLLLFCFFIYLFFILASLDNEDSGKVKELRADLSKTHNHLMEVENNLSALEEKWKEAKDEVNDMNQHVI